MNDTTNTEHEKYRSYVKKAWVIYALLTIVFIVVLVLFVAQDNEERFFFTIMPAAAAYVLRPTERYMSRVIHKFTGVSNPAEKE
jgi:cytochrome bd-type quinol oxidase subunit 2